jgi:hypothetical protein
MRLAGLFVATLLMVQAGCKAQTPGAPPEPSAARPVWHVHSAIPLFLGDGGIQNALQGKDGTSPLISRLQSEHKLVPLDVLTEESLARVSHVFLLQPSALPPEELVAFDAWVRGGGRVIIFADPDMVWPTKAALGGPGAPPPSTLLDGLFRHWGLRLNGMRGETSVGKGTVFGAAVVTVNPGQWVVTGSDQACKISDAGLAARCKLGKGVAILVGDADLADPRLWAESGQDNLPVIAGLLAQLEG